MHFSTLFGYATSTNWIFICSQREGGRNPGREIQAHTLTHRTLCWVSNWFSNLAVWNWILTLTALCMAIFLKIHFKKPFFLPLYDFRFHIQQRKKLFSFFLLLFHPLIYSRHTGKSTTTVCLSVCPLAGRLHKRTDTYVLLPVMRPSLAKPYASKDDLALAGTQRRRYMWWLFELSSLRPARSLLASFNFACFRFPCLTVQGTF